MIAVSPWNSIRREVSEAGNTGLGAGLHLEALHRALPLQGISTRGPSEVDELLVVAADQFVEGQPEQIGEGLAGMENHAVPELGDVDRDRVRLGHRPEVPFAVAQRPFHGAAATSADSR
jgi:hypothetical protein